MSDPEKTVFVSYRRSSSQYLARAIFMDLRANGWDVFFDVNTIDSGIFDHIILNQIAARAHFVLVLSPNALERCKHPDDWLRREIEEAIRLRRNIVPVVEEGFNFENEKRFLPDTIKDLPRFNALRITHDYFEEGMDRLRTRFLKKPFSGSIAPIPHDEQIVVERQIEEVSKSVKILGEYFIQAFDYQLSGFLDKAIACYSKILELEPQYADAYHYRGFVQHMKGDLETAIADYTEALRYNSLLVEIYYNRGYARNTNGDVLGAIEDYNKFLKLGGGKSFGNQSVVRQWIRDLEKRLTQQAYQSFFSKDEQLVQKKLPF